MDKTAAADVMIRLRHATAPAHARLDASLGLLDDPPARERFVSVLERFHGFHAVWEPALLSRQDCAAFFTPRQRLGLVRQDLLALGCDPVRIAALAVCTDAAALARDRAAATGALYVMEGATLGGQVIARVLADASWLPAGGLGFFTPYGPRTGAMWREFGDFARATAAVTGDEPVIDGALACFDVIQAWLRPPADT